MPMFKRSLLILLLLAAAAAGFAVHSLTGRTTLPEPDGQAMKAQTQDVVVYVSGAVQKPGVIKLKEGASGKEAVEACGGFLPSADKNSVNPAAVLQDGAMLKIAEKNLRRETPERADKRTNREANKKGGADALVNINTADVQTLQRLHGIGPALAQRIADYRREHGAFKSLDELAQVKGIGPAKVEKLRAQVEL